MEDGSKRFPVNTDEWITLSSTEYMEELTLRADIARMVREHGYKGVQMVAIAFGQSLGEFMKATGPSTLTKVIDTVVRYAFNAVKEDQK